MQLLAAFVNPFLAATQAPLCVQGSAKLFALQLHGIFAVEMSSLLTQRRVEKHGCNHLKQVLCARKR